MLTVADYDVIFQLADVDFRSHFENEHTTKLYPVAMTYSIKTVIP